MKWIPVTERLPTEERYYHTKGSHICCYWHDDSKMFDLKGVTHWLDESTEINIDIEKEAKYFVVSKGIINKIKISQAALIEILVQFAASLPSSSVTGESEAIAVIEFLLDVNANGLKGDRFHKIEMCDGEFYWETDKDGDQPMDGKDIYNLYKQSKK